LSRHDRDSGFPRGQGASGGIPVADAKLLARAIAIGVDRRLRHPELAGDLLGTEVTVDQT
jgi:hypothetical protein